ncbi:MAG: hypothetical protein HOJ57_37230 [Lentisphaerae bacterium]|nr:hypothetical protein [Lentisphaerota bacterium]MBT5611643.1 hypothetical protein [Lentisphaerota bacterium]
MDLERRTDKFFQHCQAAEKRDELQVVVGGIASVDAELLVEMEEERTLTEQPLVRSQGSEQRKNVLLRGNVPRIRQGIPRCALRCECLDNRGGQARIGIPSGRAEDLALQSQGVQICN